MKKFLILILSLLLLSTTIYASEGEIYQKEDGFYYKIIDGKEYKIDTGSSNGGSLGDFLNNYTETHTPDDKVMAETGGFISKYAGLATSIIIYLIFAGIGLVTVLDLTYISVPPLRSFLYTQNNAVQQSGSMVQQTQNKTGNKLISDELVFILNQTSNNQGIDKSKILPMYFKKRSISIIYTVIVMVLLLMSSVFTDLGLNIGQLVLDILGSLLGF